MSVPTEEALIIYASDCFLWDIALNRFCFKRYKNRKNFNKSEYGLGMD